MSEQLTTRGGVRYKELHPIYKYMVTSVAKFDIPERYALDMSGRDGVVIRARVGAVDVARITSSAVWVYPKYCWDGASGPAIDTATFMDGSLLHDVLCQAIDDGRIDPANQERADAIMRAVNIKNGMTRMRAWVTWYAVRKYRERKVADYDWPRV